MKHFSLLLLAIGGSMISCTDPAGSDGASTPVTDSVTASATSNSVDLSQQDMPLLVNVPETGTPAAAIMNEEMGRVEVRAGDHFGIIVTEMAPDFARLKADLERDMLLKNTIVQETPDLLVYRSEYPDGAGTFMHFMQVVESGTRTYVVEDLPDGRFNESDAKAMVVAVTAKPGS
ncbi:MAG: hypothetical protein ABI599_18480 [Flavobacteriales bacterium]